jgi:REP element-mobilizing transposase RayT
MPPPDPIYAPSNTSQAYQLNWSLAIFPHDRMPPESEWIEQLKIDVERDSVRILEHRKCAERAHQFLLSTRPETVPSGIVRTIKGRLQYLVRGQCPRAFHRNYRIQSVGESNNACLQAYAGKQPARHPMADPQVQSTIESLQFFDRAVNLVEVRNSSHGQFQNNLHLVFENRDRLPDISEQSLRTMQATIRKCSMKKGHLLSRIGLVANHVHILLGCGVDESPQSVALALMNNLAFAFGMKAILDFSYYAGTFGSYDRDAVRRQLSCS